MTQAKDSLARLTLRQLRLKASELGVPLYSRKSKASLIDAIALYQSRKEANENLPIPTWRSFANKSLNIKNIESTDDTRVVFLPRDPEWAYVFWEISEVDRKRAMSHGANRLCLRLVDVTGSSTNSVYPQALQEVQVDSHSTEWYLPMPISDRDYRVELGYKSSSRWISLAFSSIARVPSLHPSDQILDQFVPFSLDTNSLTSSSLVSTQVLSSETKDIGLHERLYQNATTNLRRTRIGSEEFQENFSSQIGFNESGRGVWASGRNESGIGGVFPQKRTFWLVADAELIVYGATDPSANVTIGGEDVPLSSDGTFRLQVPFRDGVQKYPIEATISNGEQSRNITMQFERLTPVDNTTPKESAQSEWFT